MSSSKKEETAPQPAAAPSGTGSPGAGTVVGVLLFLAMVGAGGWFTYAHYTAPPKVAAQLPIPPTPRFTQAEDQQEFGVFDTERFSEFLVQCDLPPLRQPLPPVEKEQCLGFYEALKALGANRTADNYGFAGMYFHFWELGAEARTCYEAAARLDPAAHRWRHYIAYIDLDEGKLAAAEEGFKAAMKLDPTYGATPMQLGRLYRQSDRLEEAREMFLKARAVEPENPYPHAELGAIALLKGELGAAREHLLAALNRDPNDRRAHAELSRVFDRLGDASRSEYHQALAGEGANYADPVPDNLIMDLRRKTNAVAYLQALAEVQADKGMYRELLETMKQLVARDPRQEWKMRLAEAYALNKQYDVAREAGQRAIAQRPDVAAAHVKLGDIEKHAGDLAAALAKADEALALDPGSGQAWRLKAECLGQSKRYEEALEAVEKGLELGETDFRLHKVKGQVIFNIGYRHVENAVAMEQANGGRASAAALAEMEKAAPYYPRALASLERARDLVPANDEVLKLLEELGQKSAEFPQLLESRRRDLERQKQAASQPGPPAPKP